MRRHHLNGRQYWRIFYWNIPIPRWWLDHFGWGYLKGNIVQRFLEQRRRRKIAVEIGRRLDVLGLANRMCRLPGETDDAFSQRLMRGRRDR